MKLASVALVAAVAFGLGALVGSGVAHVLNQLDDYEIAFEGGPDE